MRQIKKATAHQITIKTQEEGKVYLDPETLEELHDPEHILAVKNSREEYRRGEARPFKELLNKLK